MGLHRRDDLAQAHDASLAIWIAHGVIDPGGQPEGRL
jgi:hypothetical protein